MPVEVCGSPFTHLGVLSAYASICILASNAAKKVWPTAVEPLIEDTPRKGHRICMLDLCIRDTAHGLKNAIPYSCHVLRTSKERRGQPLYKGQNS